MANSNPLRWLVSRIRGLRGGGGRSGVVGAAGIMFALVMAWRFAEPNPGVAVGVLYTIPISLLAVRFGVRGGASGAIVAVLLTAVWVQVEQSGIGDSGYLVRAMAYFGVGLVVGWQSDRRNEAERQTDGWVDLATRDPLTGVANRRGWDERVTMELGRAQRSGESLCVALVDLDKLKLVNDNEGHAAGDRLLVASAQAWSLAIRDVDLIARLGGDEFAVLLPACEQAAAGEVVERMRAATPNHHPFSAGIATWDHVQSATKLVGRADQALYRAKARSTGDSTATERPLERDWFPRRTSKPSPPPRKRS
jgi:diguanylate cyclase (GGDEF)-like protein